MNSRFALWIFCPIAYYGNLSNLLLYNINSTHTRVKGTHNITVDEYKIMLHSYIASCIPLIPILKITLRLINYSTSNPVPYNKYTHTHTRTYMDIHSHISQYRSHKITLTTIFYPQE